MKAQTPVSILGTTLRGTVTLRRFREDTDDFEYLVRYDDAAGVPQERWFTAAQIQEIPA